MELCWNWFKTYELVKDLVEEVILTHPLKVKAIASARIKTDAIDARTLAELLMANLIPQAHLRKAENRVRQKESEPPCKSFSEFKLANCAPKTG